jgi:hypothetical protein
MGALFVPRYDKVVFEVVDVAPCELMVPEDD